jgi:4-amino-4-deoxy-L-arabinose transferase-like glycosyltransferase
MGLSIGNVYAAAASRPTGRQAVQTAFWAAWFLTLGIHVVLATRLLPFGDEAWYWQESRALDWSFSDIPAATAFLIRVGETFFGHGLFGMRAMFLLLGALIPIVVMRTSTRLFGTTAGAWSGLLAVTMPLIGVMGIFALPDAPLTFCTVVALDRLEAAARTNRTGAWIALGLALAGAWMSHYRAAIPLAAGFCFLCATPRGRALWSNPKLWLALAIMLIGALPLLIFNVQHDWVALHFQVVDRNPWAFHGDALAQPVEQAIVCTPLFYVMLLWTAVVCAVRMRAGAPWDLLAVCALVPILLFFFLGLYADDTRFRVHWPIPGYAPLLIAIPPLFFATRSLALRIFTIAACALLVVGALMIYAYLTAATVPDLAQRFAGVKAFPEHFVGWDTVSSKTQDLLTEPAHQDDVLVADNFMLAAELDFALGATRPVYSLDHPTNLKHGRAPQLAQWHRDEAALRELGAKRVLLVVEPTARRERERAEWLSTLCQRVDDLKAVTALDPFGGRKKYRWFSGNVATQLREPSKCEVALQ